MTKSCFAFKGEIPYQGEEITNRIEKVHGVLDELMDFASEMADNFSQGGSPIPQTPPDIFSLLSAFLKPPTPSPVNHGETLTEERPIYEVEENIQETQTETILD